MVNILYTYIQAQHEQRAKLECLNVYLRCCKATLQALKICAVVSLLHRVHMASVILHLLRLVGDGIVSYVEARQKEVSLAGIAIKEKSLTKQLIHLVH